MSRGLPAKSSNLPLSAGSSAMLCLYVFDITENAQGTGLAERSNHKIYNLNQLWKKLFRRNKKFIECL